MFPVFHLAMKLLFTHQILNRSRYSRPQKKHNLHDIILGGSFRHICIMGRNKRILILYIIYFDCVFSGGVKALWDSHVDNKNADVLIFFLLSLFFTSTVSKTGVRTESFFYLTTLCLHSRRSSDYGEGICNTYYNVEL